LNAMRDASDSNSARFRERKALRRNANFVL